MDLEYKVLQAQTPLFADTGKMQEILEEEARAGWRLIEKKDNYHLKLQREISHRDNDASLDFDAYRSNVGLSATVTYGVTALVTLAVVALILYLALWNQV